MQANFDEKWIRFRSYLQRHLKEKEDLTCFLNIFFDNFFSNLLLLLCKINAIVINTDNFSFFFAAS